MKEKGGARRNREEGRGGQGRPGEARGERERDVILF